MNPQRILFIGAGRMARAIVAGLVRNASDSIAEIIVANRSNQARLQALQTQYGVTITPDWRTQVGRADVVLLAIPPQEHRELLRELAPVLTGQFVVTVAAGVGVSMLESELPAQTPVAWVMPNTAADLSESITLVTYGQAAEAKHREVLQMILRGIGDVSECTEQQVHDLTAITGSAPAFVYRLVEVLEVAAQDYGVSAEQARQLVVQMLYGSACMLRQGTPPEELRNQVTTPGGATAAGLQVMEERRFAQMIKEAVLATNARAKEMSED